MNTTEHVFEVNRPAVARYFALAHACLILLTTVWFFGLGLVLALVYYALIAPWLSVQQAEALQYRLEGTTLRVDSGVYFLKRKAIPLDRVTDVVLVQGPLMRYLGLWAINIQTAGSGQQVAEAVLYGVDGPEDVRDLLVRARDAAAAKERD
jgi:membrane protein YdbS with pleckstrin-like domain